jgi:hypothetical protein
VVSLNTLVFIKSVPKNVSKGSTSSLSKDRSTIGRDIVATTTTSAMVLKRAVVVLDSPLLLPLLADALSSVKLSWMLLLSLLGVLVFVFL